MGYVSSGMDGATLVSDGFASLASRLKPLSALFHLFLHGIFNHKTKIINLREYSFIISYLKSE